jgi:hypothetical protein
MLSLACWVAAEPLYWSDSRVRTAAMFSPAIWPWLALAMKWTLAAYHSRVIRTMKLASKLTNLNLRMNAGPAQKARFL